MGLSRRDFLRLAAVGAAGAACGSGSDRSAAEHAEKAAVRKGERTLRILRWNHFVPAYDGWFDNEYTRRWGEAHDVQVVVEHISQEQLPARAETEVAAQRGHDLFFIGGTPATLEDEVVDVRDIVEEVTARVGPMTAVLERTVFNPKTRRWFAFPDSWTPGPVHYRTDIWDAVGIRPDTWDDVVAGASRVKVAGHPLGIGVSPSVDTQITLLSLLHAYGASVQDEAAEVVINRPQTVEALSTMAAVFRQGMTDDVLTWDSAANNRFLAEGRGSLIVNAVSALRAIEAQDPGLAARIALLPTPAGPAGRHGVYGTFAYVIWKFSPNQELAKQFLVDFAIDSREAFVKSQFFDFPAFPGAVPDLAALLGAEAGGKYRVLSGAADWTTNLGYPGFTNAAVAEVFTSFHVSRMFASVVSGEAGAEEAASVAEAGIKPIFEKWRERGKI
ncbi:MAG TPA: extracellular solute-binding protein [Acidimicrobiia bacterium]|nr:extracellular solute-binding protein [Acidimicrobiia bacterium]